MRYVREDDILRHANLWQMEMSDFRRRFERPRKVDLNTYTCTYTRVCTRHVSIFVRASTECTYAVLQVYMQFCKCSYTFTRLGAD